jgi:DNA-binding transcriptional LysR family regulator
MLAAAVQWDDVRVLLALLRSRKLDAAARGLGLDPSTLSRRLARLEERLDARLFERTREGLRPTRAAEALRPHAEAMELEAAALLQELRAEETRVSGVVRVAATEALGRILVAEGLLAVRGEHPDLLVELFAENRPMDLARGEADIAVRLAELRQSSLRARCVAKTGVALFAAPAYLRARGTVRTPAGLRGHDVLVPSGDLSRLPESRWLASRPGVRVVFRSNSMPALLAAAVAGHGIVPLPVGWGESEPALERVLSLEAIPKRKVWLVTHPTTGDRPAVRVVFDRLVSIFERVFPR